MRPGDWGTPITGFEEFLILWIALWAIIVVWMTVMLVVP